MCIRDSDENFFKDGMGKLKKFRWFAKGDVYASVASQTMLQAHALLYLFLFLAKFFQKWPHTCMLIF